MIIDKPLPPQTSGAFFDTPRLVEGGGEDTEDAITSLLGTGACELSVTSFLLRMPSEPFRAGNLQGTPDVTGQWGSDWQES